MATLLEWVAKGEDCVITKHGRPAAKLMPVSARDSARMKEAIAGVRTTVRTGLARGRMRMQTPLRSGKILRHLVHEGQRV